MTPAIDSGMHLSDPSGRQDNLPSHTEWAAKSFQLAAPPRPVLASGKWLTRRKTLLGQLIIGNPARWGIKIHFSPRGHSVGTVCSGATSRPVWLCWAAWPCTTSSAHFHFLLLRPWVLPPVDTCVSTCAAWASASRGLSLWRLITLCTTLVILAIMSTTVWFLAQREMSLVYYIKCLVSL